jgi:hypothetical protein
MDGRVQCALGEFEAIDVLRDGVGDNEGALTCMAVQDVTAKSVLDNNPNYTINSVVTDILATLVSPDFFSDNGGKDGKPTVDAINPATGKNYNLTMFENILQRAAAGAETYM